MKLGISKAHDRIEWPYLRAILLKLGFSPLWTNLVMAMVTTVLYSFIINGCPRGYLHSSRSLLQGDPLSPYLFLLCAECLSALLAKSKRDDLLTGISICPGAPTVNHLLFADDSLLFSQANEIDCLLIAKVLYDYESASGQKVNLQKSEICFSRNIKSPLHARLGALLGVRVVNYHEKYMCMPFFVGRNRS